MTGYVIFLSIVTPALLLVCAMQLLRQRELLREFELQLRDVRAAVARREHTVYTKRLFEYADRARREGVRGDD